MLFSRWRLRKFRAFFSVGAEKIMCLFSVGAENILFFLFCCCCFLFCFVFVFFSTWNSRTCGFAYLFLKSFTFACGWEKLCVIVRVTFSFFFFCLVWFLFGFCFCFLFFFLFDYSILLSGRVVLSALGRPMCLVGQ